MSYKTNYTVNDWKEEFVRQESKIKEAFPNERVKQCLDKNSFNMRYYNPYWVVTDAGNIWSLWEGRPIQANAEGGGKRKKNGEYSAVKYSYRNKWPESIAKNNRKYALRIYSHQIVANYFCDKTVIDRYGEDNVEVHHEFGYDETLINTDVNMAEHIQYILKEDHDLVNALQTGNGIDGLLTREEIQHELKEDPYIQKIIQNAKRVNGFQNGIKIIYHEDGTTDLQVIIGGRRTVDNTTTNL